MYRITRIATGLVMAAALAPARAQTQAAPLYVTVITHFDAPWTMTNQDIIAMRFLSILHPYVRYTHLFNPVAYARTTPLLSSIESYLRESRDQTGAEIGVHLHMYPELMQAAGVAMRNGPGLNGSPPCADDPTGYAVPMSAYTAAEMEKMLRWSVDQMRGKGLCHPRTFCPGYYTSNVALQKVLVDLGFTVSASAFPNDAPGAKYGPCWTAVTPWGTAIDEMTLPYRVPVGSVLPSTTGPWLENEFGPLVEIPQTTKIDFQVTEQDLKTVFDRHLAVAKNGTPTAVCLAFHDINANSSFNKYNRTLGYIAAKRAAGENIVFVTASGLRDAFLGSEPQPLSGIYRLFGAGCSGTASPHRSVFSANSSCSTIDDATSSDEIAIECVAPAAGADVVGAALTTAAVGGVSSDVTVEVRLEATGGGPAAMPVRTGIAHFETRVARSTAWWAPLQIAPGKKYYITYSSDTVRQPVCSTGGQTVPYWSRPNAQATWTQATQPSAFAVEVLGVGTGSGALPQLDSVGAPRLGESLTVRLASAPANAPAVLLLGNSSRFWSSFRLPFDLSPFGAPGCSLQVSPDFSTTATSDPSGRVSKSFPVPNDAQLICGDFSNQWVVLDTNANSLGIAVSNRGYAVIGQ